MVNIPYNDNLKVTGRLFFISWTNTGMNFTKIFKLMRFVRNDLFKSIYLILKGIKSGGLCAIFGVKCKDFPDVATLKSTKNGLY